MRVEFWFDGKQLFVWGDTRWAPRKGDKINAEISKAIILMVVTDVCWSAHNIVRISLEED